MDIRLQYLPCIVKLISYHQAITPSPPPPDPYVRVLLLNKGRLLKKKKTGYCTNTGSPQWNQTLIFSLQTHQVCGISIGIISISISILYKRDSVKDKNKCNKLQKHFSNRCPHGH